MGALFQNIFNKYIWDFRSGGVSLENPKAPINGWLLDQVLGGGAPVSYEASLTLSAFYRAVVIKSGVLSSLPYKMYRRTASGREEVKPSDHPVALMFSGKGYVNEKQTKTIYLEHGMGQYDIRGRHYAKIVRRRIDGKVVALKKLLYEKVTRIEDNDRVVYKIQGDDRVYSSDEIIDVSNFEGKSVLQKAQEDFELQMNTRDYGQKFFAGGGKPLGVFLPKGTVTNEQREQLIQSYQKAKSRQTDVALPFGWEYKELSIAPAEAEFLGTSQAGVANISRWTGVPLYKLADMSAATRNNVEQQSIEFLQDTMGPIGNKFENEHNAKLLNLPSEEDLYLEFNWDAYIKTDTKTKMEAMATQIQNAILMPSEARKMLNLQEVDGSDKLFIQGATVPINLQERMVMAKSTTPSTQQRNFTEDELLEMLIKITNGRH